MEGLSLGLQDEVLNGELIGCSGRGNPPFRVVGMAGLTYTGKIDGSTIIVTTLVDVLRAKCFLTKCSTLF
jgi:hypothetical protein